MRQYRQTLAPETIRHFLHYNPKTGVWKWRRSPHRNIKQWSLAGTQSQTTYNYICLQQKQFPTHRLAWVYMTGAWPLFDLDHKDTDRSNCRWANLRPATPQQNSANKNKTYRKKGCKGVFVTPQNTFRAIIGYKNKTFSLGTFSTAELASAAYVKAAKKYFGEYARP